MNNNWHKKEKPLLGLTGLGGGVDGLAVVGAAAKTYVDDVFSTYLYKGNSGSQTINNSIDFSGEGGLLWLKNRDDSSTQNILTDTVRGVNEVLYSDANNGQASSNMNQSFNSNGWSMNCSFGDMNQNNKEYASWSFRKAPGFFDIVTYEGNGTAGRTVSHNLGCVPGMIILKTIDSSNDWVVGHRGLHPTAPWNYRLQLDTNGARSAEDTTWQYTAPTSTEFTVGGHDRENKNGDTFIAYLFAGGESTAATARSVDFDGSGDYLVTNTSSDYDFGTGDFTAEHWIKPDSFTTAQILDARATGDTGSNWCTYITTDNTYRFNSVGGDRITSTTKLSIGQWTHCAIVRNSGTTTLYINGISQGTYSDTNDYDDNRIVMGIHGPNLSSYPFDGKLSNVRVLKGTALYTSSFKPPTEPLTSITNTKLLCCNNSSITGTTTGTVTSGGDPTASTDNPFDDTEGFKFGADSDQGIVKCGSYTGNGSTTGPEIYLGWEPSWVLIKDTSASVNWRLHDSMRGMITGGDDREIEPNTTDEESDSDRLSLTPTGFKLTTSSASHNDPGDVYIYVAIRRPDGYVGKLPSAGTSVFAMDYGNNVNGTMSNFVSGFPVDFALMKKPAASSDWYSGSRLTGMGYLKPAADSTESNLLAFKWQSNVGWNNVNYSSAWLSWMWKRGPGLDVVTFKGNGSAREIPHSLNQVPEMIWTKNRTTDYEWNHYHKGLNGGTNPEQYYIQFTDGAEVQNSGRWNDQAPTATAFSIGTHASVNANNANIIAMLFSSVAGISKVGYYSGSTSQQTITLGFQPRFIIIRNTAGSRNWVVFDTERGWASGNDEELNLNKTDAQGGNNDFGAPTATGFTLNYFGNDDTNNSGFTYIYYAHA